MKNTSLLPLSFSLSSLGVLFTLLCLAGCAQGPRHEDDQFRGFIFMGGQGVTLTPNNWRRAMGERLTSALQPLVANPHDLAVSLSGKLRWVEPPSDSDFGEFQWITATAAIGLRPDSTANHSEIHRITRDFFAKRWHYSATTPVHIHISTMAVAPVMTDKETSTSTSTSASATTPVPASSSWPRTYTVQNGDTWADLSSAFYGTPQHWRHLMECNTGLTLTAGQILRIPAPPDK